MTLSLEDKLKLEGFKPLDRELFLSIRNEFRPHADLSGFKALREKAGRERDLRELYKDRGPYELLQNADDAHATKVAYILTEQGVAFIHNGNWFTVDNFRSLADGWSDKDPKECIGHKGLGFRSVLDITPSPYIVNLESTEFFGVKFSWALNNNLIQEAIQKDPKAKNEYEKSTKNGQLVCPIMAVPGLVNRQTLGACDQVYRFVKQGVYGLGYTTLFWFPSKDTDLDWRALNDLSPTPLQSTNEGREKMLNFLQKEVCILLPFLSSVTKVDIYVDNHLLGYASLDYGVQRKQSEKIIVRLWKETLDSTRAYFLSKLNIPLPREIRSDKDTPKALKQMDKVSIVLLAEIKDGQPISQLKPQFHVYFPTDENTGVGFTIHGDFYVKPDRTRLMTGKYNDWLLSQAAELAANEFLTQLLSEYSAGEVFKALAPNSDLENLESSSGLFIQYYSESLRKRQHPFIPSRLGLITANEAMLPAAIDRQGFWERNFSDTLPQIFPEKKAFISPIADNDQTRRFLRLAEVESLISKNLLNFIDYKLTHSNILPSDLYTYYEYMYNDPEIFRYDHSSFSGYHLILTSGGKTLAIPKDGLPIICFPSAVGKVNTEIPSLFSRIFTFLPTELTALLDQGEESLKSWVADRLKIVPFEASKLLPLAIRGIVPGIFSGDSPVNYVELSHIWIFAKELIDASPQKILDPDFWKEIGRLPLPVKSVSSNLVPAFLTFWPEEFKEGSTCLQGISTIRRIDLAFLGLLIDESKFTKGEWIDFLEKINVSNSLKVQKYSRLIGSDQRLFLSKNAPMDFPTRQFTGERQADENRAVVEILLRENIWDKYIEEISSSVQASDREIQQLTVLEGFVTCVQQALHEYQEGDDYWQDRLLNLLSDLPVITPGDNDRYLYSAGRQGLQSVEIPSYSNHQITGSPWLSTTWGPMKSNECFSRLIGRQFISSGRSEDALGDILLPYVVANSPFDLAKFAQYGVDSLEDAGSASISALIRALKILGQKLSEKENFANIVEVKSRWRLVRGAIQDIYRRLNQEDFDMVSDILFSSRIGEKINFRPLPLYFAAPGSPIEQAFRDLLPLLDADQVFSGLFTRLGIFHLEPGKTIEERFISENLALPAMDLQQEIVDRIAPYLMAAIFSRSDRTRQIRVVPRRLKERFCVKAAESLRVSFSLLDDPLIRKEVEYPKFYPQRIISPGSGATTEVSYTLFFKGSEKSTLANLDADALGEALATVFLDGLDSGSELFGLFPRIVVRYKEVGGKPDQMQDYLLHQLGITIDAQEEAKAILDPQSEPLPPLPPPPARIIVRQTPSAEEQPLESIGERISSLREDLTQEVDQLAIGLHYAMSGGINQPSSGPMKRSNTYGHFVTPEQEARGRKGELEILRRLQLSGGWESFTYIDDKRQESVGYDFGCMINDRIVCVEVKTFALSGQVVMTTSELQAAASYKKDYYLIGLLDDGGPENGWKAYILQNPLVTLLEIGQFDFQPKLHIPAVNVFGIEAMF